MPQASTRLPDFLIVGAQKCGTTALRHNLSLHPRVHVPLSEARNPQEFQFFSDDEQWSRGVEAYQACFDQPDKLQGEKSPHYLDVEAAHPRMAEVLPDAKLIVMLRNPISRAYSAWNHYNQDPELFARWGWKPAPFEQAIERDDELSRQLIDFGCYALNIQRLLTWFPRDQVHFVISERLRADPDGEYRRVQEFLGLEQIEPWQQDKNVRQYPEPMSASAQAYLQALFAPYNRALFAMLGESIEEWGELPALPQQPPQEPTFDIVITCKGRLEHLKQTLPLAVAQPDAQVFVVDYSCPDNSGDWVEANYPSVKVVRVPGREHYNRSESRNAGARAGDSPWLLFMDADILAHHRFVDELFERLEPNASYHEDAPKMTDRTGTFACQRSVFESLGGYDETMSDWGAEDIDLHRNLRHAGVRKQPYDHRLLVPIAHEDEMRTRFHQEQDIALSNLANTLYSSVRRDVESMTGQTLPEQAKQTMYRSVRTVIDGVLERGHGDAVRMAISREPLYGLSLTRVLHYHIGPVRQEWMPGEPDAPLPSFKSVLGQLRERWPQLQTNREEQPVFVLASGPGSGGELLANMLAAGCDLWAQPYGEADPLDGVTRLFRHLRADWPRSSDLAEDAPPATRQPPLQSLVDATLAYLLTLLRDPGAAGGARPWGLLEFRHSVDMAHCLRWLFPRARIVFLIRDPYAGYAASQAMGTLYRHWPDKALSRPDQFAALWLRQVPDFVRDAAVLDAYLLRYEDLLSDSFDSAPLQAYLGVPLATADLSLCPADVDIGSDKLAELASLLGERAAELGYPAP